MFPIFDNVTLFIHISKFIILLTRQEEKKTNIIYVAGMTQLINKTF